MKKIIRAHSEHAARLTQITIAAKRHWNYPEKWIQLWLPSLTITAEYLDSNETWVMMDDQLVAYYSFNQNEEGFWLDNLWVSPEYMGQGIGRSLFEHALERCKSLGVSNLKIEADPHAQSFYERMGALKTGEHLARIDGETRILPVMEIEL